MSDPDAPCRPLIQPLDLSSKSVLVTGGATGLGLATVHAFAAANAHITIVTNVATSQTVLWQFLETGAHVQEIVCDICDWNALNDAFKRAMAFSPSGTLDVVAMFAGVDKGQHLVDQIAATAVDNEPVQPSTLEIDVNLKGTLYTTSLALHYFRRNPAADKCLITVSSLAGYIDDTHNSVYTASKFGSRGLWRSIRAKAASDMGVRCNLIAPWAIKTPMTAPILGILEQLGIKEGEGITFANEETVVEAVMKCVGDQSISGRAFAVMPEGFFDIGDDVEGAYGGEVLQSLMAMRRQAGDFLQG